MIAMTLPKKIQRELLVVFLLVGVFALTLSGALKNAGVFRPRVSKPAATMTPRVQQASAATTTTITTPLVKSADQPRYTAYELRDPLQSLLPESHQPGLSSPTGSAQVSASKVPTPPSLVLEGVVWGGPEPQAIIDGAVYGVGDVVQGVLITAIGRTGMTVDFQGTPVQVAVRQGAVERATPRKAQGRKK